MKKAVAFILIFAAMFIWGTSYIVMKGSLDNINSGLLVFIRSIIASLVLIPFSIKGFKQMNKKQLLLMLITGIFVAFGYLCQVSGLSYTTPARNAFLEDFYCVVTPIVLCIILKKKPQLSTIISISICIIGIIIISYKSLGNSTINIGDMLSLLCGFFYGLNIAFTGVYAKDINPISYTCGQHIIMSIISLAYTLIFEDNSNIVLNSNIIFSMLYLGLIVSALAWVLRNQAQKTLSPITVSIILPFSAVVGTIFSIFFKEDTLSIELIIGGLLIMSSIILDSLLPKIIYKKNLSVEK